MRSVEEGKMCWTGHGMFLFRKNIVRLVSLKCILPTSVFWLEHAKYDIYNEFEGYFSFTYKIKSH